VNVVNLLIIMCQIDFLTVVVVNLHMIVGKKCFTMMLTF